MDNTFNPNDYSLYIYKLNSGKTIVGFALPNQLDKLIMPYYFDEKDGEGNTVYALTPISSMISDDTTMLIDMNQVLLTPFKASKQFTSYVANIIKYDLSITRNIVDMKLNSETRVIAQSTSRAIITENDILNSNIDYIKLLLEAEYTSVN